MTTAFSPCPKRTDWRPLYKAAILETDKKILPQRVLLAEAAVIARRREIFYAGGTAEGRLQQPSAVSLPQELPGLEARKDRWSNLLDLMRQTN